MAEPKQTDNLQDGSPKKRIRPKGPKRVQRDSEIVIIKKGFTDNDYDDKFWTAYESFTKREGQNKSRQAWLNPASGRWVSDPQKIKKKQAFKDALISHYGIEEPESQDNTMIVHIMRTGISGSANDLMQDIVEDAEDQMIAEAESKTESSSVSAPEPVAKAVASTEPIADKPDAIRLKTIKKAGLFGDTDDIATDSATKKLEELGEISSGLNNVINEEVGRAILVTNEEKIEAESISDSVSANEQQSPGFLGVTYTQEEMEAHLEAQRIESERQAQIKKIMQDADGGEDYDEEWVRLRDQDRSDLDYKYQTALRTPLPPDDAQDDRNTTSDTDSGAETELDSVLLSASPNPEEPLQTAITEINPINPASATEPNQTTFGTAHTNNNPNKLILPSTQKFDNKHFKKQFQMMFNTPRVFNYDDFLSVYADSGLSHLHAKLLVKIFTKQLNISPTMIQGKPDSIVKQVKEVDELWQAMIWKRCNQTKVKRFGAIIDLKSLGVDVNQLSSLLGGGGTVSGGNLSQSDGTVFGGNLSQSDGTVGTANLSRSDGTDNVQKTTEVPPIMEKQKPKAKHVSFSSTTPVKKYNMPLYHKAGFGRFIH
jgi:hypothetical protein